MGQGKKLFENKYKGLTKEEVNEFKESYDRYKILTDRIE